jgi:hypothetical protein
MVFVASTNIGFIFFTWMACGSQLYLHIRIKLYFLVSRVVKTYYNTIYSCITFEILFSPLRSSVWNGSYAIYWSFVPQNTGFTLNIRVCRNKSWLYFFIVLNGLAPFKYQPCYNLKHRSLYCCQILWWFDFFVTDSWFWAIKSFNE